MRPSSPRSSPLSFSKSSSDNKKSNISTFCLILSGLLLFGMTATFCCVRWRNRICPSVLLCFLAISLTVGWPKMSGKLSKLKQKMHTNQETMFFLLLTYICIYYKNDCSLQDSREANRQLLLCLIHHKIS